MIFEAHLGQAKALKQIIEGIKDFAKEVNLECSLDGIVMKAQDTQKIALVHLKIDSSGFEYYRCDSNFSIGISVQNLHKVLQNSSDHYSVKLNSDGVSVLNLHFEDTQFSKQCDFSLNLLQLEDYVEKIPDTQFYEAEGIFKAVEFERICKVLSNISETVKIKIRPQQCDFLVQSKEGNGFIQYKETNELQSICKISSQSTLEVSFSLRYLNIFNKAAPLNDTVKFKLHPEYPLVIEYNFKIGPEGITSSQLQERHGFIHYYLSPKIESVEESKA